MKTNKPRQESIVAGIVTHAVGSALLVGLIFVCQGVRQLEVHNTLYYLQDMTYSIFLVWVILMKTLSQSDSILLTL